LNSIGSKKKSDFSLKQNRSLIDIDDQRISVRRQCQLLGLSRSSLYYQATLEKEENLCLMRLLDEQYTRTPFYGIRRMTAWLQKQGYKVNHKRVQRLLRKMGLEAIYAKPRTTISANHHKIYPYLLRGTKVARVNQVWSADITYIRLLQGFIYLVAIIDWYSRYVLSWEVSITLESDFCLAALESALEIASPEIFNTDQGVQFTSHDFTGRLSEREIRISMDGRGRALDNIFVERLWRSVKYEEVYLKDYENVVEARSGLSKYFAFYNQERLHQSLKYQTPESIYWQKA
jgi:putative transposase